MVMIRPLFRLLVPLVLLVLFAGSPAPALAGGPLKIVATFSILADMARQVGGDKVEVTSLVGPGGDAHVYEPAPGDVRALAAADAIIVNGLGMEGWMDRLIQVSSTHAPVIVASSGVAPLTMTGPDAGEGRGGKTVTDPHAWQDLANGRLYALNIGEGLAGADPGDAGYFRARARDYAARLAALDARVRAMIAGVPQEKRRIITSHDAFGYFGRAYGVTFLAPLGISTDAEPSAAALGRLSRQIKREHIGTLFLESMGDPRLVSALARECGARLGKPVYSDSLSPQGGEADTYEAMFAHNVPLFVAAMTGD